MRIAFRSDSKGLVLHQDEQLRAAKRLQGGVLTTASAMGMVLIERLQARGFKITFDGPL